MDVLGMIHYLAGEEETRAWACAVGLAQDLPVYFQGQVGQTGMSVDFCGSALPP